MAEALSCWLAGHRHLVLWLAGLVLVLGAGCATPNHPDSDLPWNMQQPWETAPAIPGLN
jgi:hypothetical protein